MEDSPPFSVCLSFDDQEYDDRSELTWASGRVENLDDEGTASPPNYDTWDGIGMRPMRPSQLHRSKSVSRLDERHEFVNLKMQIANQKEKLDILSSKLRQSQAEIEILKAEKTSLIDELALDRDAVQESGEERSSSSSSLSRRLSMRGFGLGANEGSGGSIQMLLDRNAKLMTENARLQVSEDGIRKSFQSHIRRSLRSSRSDKEKIETLQREIRQLHCQLSDMSDHTAKTTLDLSVTERDFDDLPIDSSRHSMRDVLGNSLHSIPEQNDVEHFQLDNEEPWSRSASLKFELNDRYKPRSSLDNSYTDQEIDDFPIDCSQHSLQDKLVGSLHSIPEQEDNKLIPGIDTPELEDNKDSPSGVDIVYEDKGIEAGDDDRISGISTRRHSISVMRNESATSELKEFLPRRKSEPGELLVDFGEVGNRRHRTTKRQWSSFTNDTASFSSVNVPDPSNEPGKYRSLSRTWSFSSLIG